MVSHPPTLHPQVITFWNFNFSSHSEPVFFFFLHEKKVKVDFRSWKTRTLAKGSSLVLSSIFTATRLSVSVSSNPDIHCHSWSEGCELGYVNCFNEQSLWSAFWFSTLSWSHFVDFWHSTFLGYRKDLFM